MTIEEKIAYVVLFAILVLANLVLVFLKREY